MLLFQCHDNMDTTHTQPETDTNKGAIKCKGLGTTPKNCSEEYFSFILINMCK